MLISYCLDPSKFYTKLPVWVHLSVSLVFCLFFSSPAEKDMLVSDYDTQVLYEVCASRECSKDCHMEVGFLRLNDVGCNLKFEGVPSFLEELLITRPLSGFCIVLAEKMSRIVDSF